MTQLSLILPCYNPPQGWCAYAIDRIYQLQQSVNASFEVILVNDGSERGITQDDIAQLQSAIAEFKYIFLPENNGKGAALRAGVAAASKAYLVYTDIDLPYSNHSMTTLILALINGSAQVVTGFRDLSYYAHTPISRRFISRVFRWFLKSALQLKTADTQCGLKGFARQVKPIFLQTQTNRYLFDFEFIRLCSINQNINLKEIEVELRPGVEFSTMTIRILIKEGFNLFRILLKDYLP